ncbi:MAG: hypothetical protein KBS35_02765 [Mycoplasma sp.]|nr:hypothetical protein [Candidatus Hennigella equi]
MKRIGILYDKDSKKTFLLPREVKALTEKGITVNIASGAGNCINVSDSAYISAGANICQQWQTVIANSDILLKTNAFSKSELKLMKKKIAITMVNYLANVEMLYYMLENQVTGLEWAALADRSNYVLFGQLEETKVPLIMNYLQHAISKGLSKSKKDLVVYPKDPSILILNATFAGVALAEKAAALGWKVTIADNDAKYLASLKKTKTLKDIECVDAGYETINYKFKTQNIFVNTVIDPLDLTKTRITKEMAKSMPKGSLLIDAACENGYAFQFVKKFADKQPKWNKFEKSFYLAHECLTDLVGQQASEIISNKSLKYLLNVVEQGTDNAVIWKITNCQDGKVVNAAINAKLRLY